MSRTFDLVAAVHADGWGRVLGRMIRFTGGDWELAEECAQDAFTAALQRWPTDGVPDRPLAWLTTTARNRAIDRMRRAATETTKLRTVAATEREPAPSAAAGSVPDERLELMFTCCHPALALDRQVALILRCLAGLSTAEIARAFLVPERTMEQRLFRAKQRIAHAGVPFRVPPPHLLPQRLPAVLQVLYLVFNQGYGDPARAVLCAEAVRWARVLAELLPDEPEAEGLLALVLLQEARRPARLEPTGDLVTLVQQDRSRWDKAMIDEGEAICERALRRGRAGPFQLQAAIAACHATAPTADATDWPQIAGLYEHLSRVMPTDVVELNRAVAIGMAEGPAAGLIRVEALAESGRIDGYYLLHATRADLLHRLGRSDEEAHCYRRAAELAPTAAERRFLLARLEECRIGDDPRTLDLDA